MTDETKQVLVVKDDELARMRIGTLFRTLLTGCVFSASLLAETVNVCDDKAEWPPYSYNERVDGKKTKKIVGGMIDVLDAISEKTGLQFKLKYIPWKRCLQEVDRFGTTKKYEMFINGSYKEERGEKYYVTLPIYHTTPGYWYSRKRHPNGMDIKTTNDLTKHKACGLLGYQYESYGFPKNKGIDTGSKSFEAVFIKLDLGRCDLVPQSAPVPFGFKALGKDIIPEGVVFNKMPGNLPGNFYMWIAKTSPRGLELLARINHAIASLASKDKIHEILLKHLSCGKHC